MTNFIYLHILDPLTHEEIETTQFNRHKVTIDLLLRRMQFIIETEHQNYLTLIDRNPTATDTESNKSLFTSSASSSLIVNIK